MGGHQCPVCGTPLDLPVLRRNGYIARDHPYNRESVTAMMSGGTGVIALDGVCPKCEGMFRVFLTVDVREIAQRILDQIEGVDDEKEISTRCNNFRMYGNILETYDGFIDVDEIILAEDDDDTWEDE